MKVKQNFYNPSRWEWCYVSALGLLLQKNHGAEYALTEASRMADAMEEQFEAHQKKQEENKNGHQIN
jgi:hypothetical protein